MHRRIFDSVQNEVVASQVIQVPTQDCIHVLGNLFRRVLGLVVDQATHLPKRPAPVLATSLYCKTSPMKKQKKKGINAMVVADTLAHTATSIVVDLLHCRFLSNTYLPKVWVLA
jgi:hypothetical protein